MNLDEYEKALLKAATAKREHDQRAGELLRGCPRTKTTVSRLFPGYEELAKMGRIAMAEASERHATLIKEHCPPTSTFK